MGWELGLCVAVKAAVLYATLNSHLKRTEEVRDVESVMKIWLMNQGQRFNDAGQGIADSRKATHGEGRND